MNWWQKMLADLVTQVLPVLVGALLHWVGTKTGVSAANGKGPPPTVGDGP